MIRNTPKKRAQKSRSSKKTKVIHIMDIVKDVHKGINMFWAGTFLKTFLEIPELATMYAKIYFINVLGLLAPSILLDNIVNQWNNKIVSGISILIKIILVLIVKWQSRKYSNELSNFAHIVGGKKNGNGPTGSHRQIFVSKTVDFILNNLFLVSLYAFLNIGIVLPYPYNAWFSIIFGSLAFAYETYDPLFANISTSLTERFQLFHRYIAYMFGFGLPIAFVSTVCNSIVLRMVIVNIVSPLCTIQAISTPLPKRSLKYTIHILYIPFWMATKGFSFITNLLTPSNTDLKMLADAAEDEEPF